MQQRQTGSRGAAFSTHGRGRASLTTLRLSCGGFLAALLAGAPTFAFASQALAQQKNCMTCHAASTRVVGPSYKEVAAKYAARDDAVDVLAEKILKGSTGQWGYVPMPPNANVTSDEARALATWITQQK